MQSIKHIFKNVTTKLIQQRSITVSSKYLKYEGEGKTTVSILNNEEGTNLMINGFSQAGFRLNNEMTVLGPMAIFPRSVLSWNIQEMGEINEDSLALFTALEPKVDILVIGVGDKIRDLTLHRKLLPFSQKHKISLEVLSTDQACSTFNFLNSEGRYVAAALLPPHIIESTDDDVLRSKMRYQNLYEIE